jgi:2-C-methyl-D-erythritol 2,4-cyclodiphosphate synthase
MRTGIGYDIHRLVSGRDLIIGGVKIEYNMGLAGHSDADVVVHAVCDALLGAASLGDIGRHFPDTDEKYKDISSLELLHRIKEKIREVNYEANNIDITVICEEPKLRDHILNMEENISRTLDIPVHDVNIKATTNEKVDSIGQNEAIAAFAVATIIPSPEI